MVTLLRLLVLVAHCSLSQSLKKSLLMPPMVEEICSYASYARRSNFLWLLWSKRYPYASYGWRSAFLIGRWLACAGFFLYTMFQFFIFVLVVGFCFSIKILVLQSGLTHSLWIFVPPIFVHNDYFDGFILTSLLMFAFGFLQSGLMAYLPLGGHQRVCCDGWVYCFWLIVASLSRWNFVCVAWGWLIRLFISSVIWATMFGCVSAALGCVKLDSFPPLAL